MRFCGCDWAENGRQFVFGTLTKNIFINKLIQF